MVTSSAEGSLEVASQATDAIQKLKVPKMVTELRSFLGICNVFRRFASNLARISAPLNLKLRKGLAVKLDSLKKEEINALRTLQEELVTPPVLALTKKKGKLVVETDAFDRKFACVFLQERTEGSKRPIGYWSLKLWKE